jgi:hypothetical protein
VDISISTPALLFPAITLLLLAYTNRFLAIATLIRNLHKNYRENPDNKIISDQLINLRKRLNLIKLMQLFGVISLFLCILSMLILFLEYGEWGNYGFGLSLLSMLISLAFGLQEVFISTKALEIELSDMESRS